MAPLQRKRQRKYRNQQWERGLEQLCTFVPKEFARKVRALAEKEEATLGEALVKMAQQNQERTCDADAFPTPFVQWRRS